MYIMRIYWNKYVPVKYPNNFLLIIFGQNFGGSQTWVFLAALLPRWYCAFICPLTKRHNASIKHNIIGLFCFCVVAAMQCQPPWGKLWVYIRRNHRLVSLAAVSHCCCLCGYLSTYLSACKLCDLFWVEEDYFYGSISFFWNAIFIFLQPGLCYFYAIMVYASMTSCVCSLPLRRSKLNNKVSWGGFSLFWVTRRDLLNVVDAE